MQQQLYHTYNILFTIVYYTDVEYAVFKSKTQQEQTNKRK